MPFLGTPEWKDPNGFGCHLGDCAEKERAALLVEGESRAAGHVVLFWAAFCFRFLGL